MKGADVGSSLVWLALGLYLTYAAWDLDLGTLHDPGSGFLLFWIGVIMVALSLGIFVGALRRPAGEGPQLVFGAHWHKVILVIAVLFAYAWALGWLGFVLTTFMLLVVLFKGVEPQRWSVALAGAVASALVAYLVFHVWLGAQLPTGVFEIG